MQKPYYAKLLDTLTIDFDVVSPEIHHDLEHKRLRCARDFTYLQERV